MTIFALVLTHFNQIMGPEIIYSFPEDVPEELGNKMKRYFDINTDDTFFEINLVKENLILVNLYFEIPSQTARGGAEMTMLSVITDKDHRSEQFHDILRNCSSRIIETSDMYKCFYNECGEEREDKRDCLKSYLMECMDSLRREITPNESKKKIVKKFKKLSW